MSATLNEIFEALVKLGTNQQTLASNLESWRLDNSGDVSIVSNRLENMERTLQETLAPSLPSEEGGPAATARLRDARTFKRWLYGTGRVLPSTWRDDVAAMRNSVAIRAVSARLIVIPNSRERISGIQDRSRDAKS